MPKPPRHGSSLPPSSRASSSSSSPPPSASPSSPQAASSQTSASTASGPSLPCTALPIHTRLGVPSRRTHPSPPKPSLTRRVILYDCQTPRHTVHAYVFETHVNGVPTPIDPAGDGALLERIRTPRCPLLARRGVEQVVTRLRGPNAMFGIPQDPECEDIETCDETIQKITTSLASLLSAERQADSHTSKGQSSTRTFSASSAIYWAEYTLTCLRATRTSLLAQRSPLLHALELARLPETEVRLAQALGARVSSHQERRAADYAAALLLRHAAMISLAAARGEGDTGDLEDWQLDTAALALLCLAVDNLLEHKPFWDPENAKSQVTLRRWLERFGDAVGEEEEVELGPLLDSLGV